ncbi:MAG: hypothetical protein JWN61_1324 [Pseudonocardiales bacterium]|nr:hypothetical protein [Pseudonocardiales bacterium]
MLRGTRTRTIAAIGAAALLGAQLVGAAVAGAAPYDSAAQIARALQSSQVVVADDSEARSKVDAAGLLDAIGRASHIYVAVLPGRALDGTPDRTAADVGQSLGDAAAVVIVLVGEELGAAQGSQAPLSSGGARDIVRNSQTQGVDVQLALRNAIAGIRTAASRGSSDSGAAPPAPTGNGSGGGQELLLVLVLLVVLAGYVMSRRRRRGRTTRDEVRGLQAEVESLHGRLGSDVSLLDPGEDRIARQALADASERFTATGALLDSSSGSPEVLAQAKRTAIEGIEAARVVRRRLGLDPGPDPMPPAPTGAPQVSGVQDVEVDGQTYTGYGSYRPGAGNYFGGGYYGSRYIPGGWYAQPFWQSTAISALAFGGLGYALGGGFGLMGGGYGTEAAYERGFDDASDGSGGFDGGSADGGDWAGGGDFGGGDFGGDFGGGDF